MAEIERLKARESEREREILKRRARIETEKQEAREKRKCLVKEETDAAGRCFVNRRLDPISRSRFPFCYDIVNVDLYEEKFLSNLASYTITKLVRGVLHVHVLFFVHYFHFNFLLLLIIFFSRFLRKCFAYGFQ